MKFFFGRSIKLPILDKNLGHWPVMFHAHASIKVWNVPREFNILPSLFASWLIWRFLRVLRACCSSCVLRLAKLRLACAALLS
jgi:hypothetical protein